jgi:hypothetical protein
MRARIRERWCECIIAAPINAKLIPPTRMKYFEHPLLLEFMKEKLKPAFNNVGNYSVLDGWSTNCERRLGANAAPGGVTLRVERAVFPVHWVSQSMITVQCTFAVVVVPLMRFQNIYNAKNTVQSNYKHESRLKKALQCLMNILDKSNYS